ncbi:hypothetical protein SPLC1_S171580 [Arthrospira platensis C1]|nr:hypothetical protein SPLC1_S171580 [Arthrospira platensis C1]
MSAKPDSIIKLERRMRECPYQSFHYLIPAGYQLSGKNRKMG